MKKIIKYAFLLVIALIVALLLAIYVFDDKIKERLKTDINKELNATVDFNELDLSILKSFPNLGVHITELNVEGKGTFDGQELANIEALDFEMNLSSLFNSSAPLIINSFSLSNPTINILVDQAGNANYDIFKSESESTSSFDLSLSQYEIMDGILTYYDQASDFGFTAEEINHEGTGDFTKNIFNLVTKTSIGSLRPRMKNIPVFSTMVIDLASEVQVDLGKSSYTLTDALLKLNDLKLMTNGSIVSGAESLDIDLDFKSFENDIKAFVSLLPNLYQGDFEKAEAKGDFKVNGFIKGSYDSARGLYPKFDFDMKAKDGSFNYPGLPGTISDILADIKVFNKSSDINDMEIAISQYNFNVDDYYLNGKFYANKLVSNPSFDMTMKGNMDLSKLKDAYPLSEFDNVSGKLDTDFSLKSNLKDIDARNFKDLIFDGYLNLSEVSIKNQNALAVEAKSVAAVVAVDKLNIDFEELHYGNSDITGNFLLDNPLNVLSDEAPLKGSVATSSKVLDIDQWLSKNVDDQQSFDDQNTVLVDLVKRMDFALDNNADKLQYASYPIESGILKGKLSDNTMSIVTGNAKMKDSDFSIEGYLSNIAEYSFKQDTMTGALKLESEFIKFEDFLAEESGDSISEVVVLVPANMNVEVTTKIDKFQYQGIDIDKANGIVQIIPDELQLMNFSGDALGGNLRMNGLYNTSNQDEPGFALKYEMGKMRFEKAFQSVKTVRLLAPIAKYIEGIFNGNLIMEGKLTKDLLPDFNTLTGSGYLETLEGKVSGYNPLDKLSKSLNLKKAKDWTIKNSKNWFEIKDGYVKMQEFNHQWNDIDMLINGSHRINQDMDYTFRAKVPRELLNQEATAVINEGIENVIGLIKKAGLDIEANYFIVDIHLTGNMLNPKIDIKPIGIDNSELSVKEAVEQVVENKIEEAKDSIETKIEETKDSINTRVNNELDSIRSALENKTEEIKDTITTVVKEKADEVKDKAKEEVTKILSSTLDSTISKEQQDSILTELQNKTQEVLGDSTATQIDSLKKKLEKWNPFKKKKKPVG